jgi:hypothetical protein
MSTVRSPFCDLTRRILPTNPTLPLPDSHPAFRRQPASRNHTARAKSPRSPPLPLEFIAVAGCRRPRRSSPPRSFHSSPSLSQTVEELATQIEQQKLEEQKTEVRFRTHSSRFRNPSYLSLLPSHQPPPTPLICTSRNRRPPSR